MSLELRLTNVLRCLQQNNLSAAGFISAILDSRHTTHAASQDSLTMNTAHICVQLYNNEDSHTSVFSWTAGTLRRELYNNDGGEEDDGVFDKRPRKWQCHAGERNVALQHIISEKTVVIISICLQNTNERCNCLQGWMGFFMKSTGIPEKVIEVMAHTGLSVSLSTIYNMVTSISKEISHDIKREVYTLHAAFAYNNFDIAFNVAQPTLKNHSSFVSATSATVIPLYSVDESNEEALWSSAKLWASDSKNPSPSLFPLMNESRSFLMLHKKNTYNLQTNPTQLSGREEAFAWHICAILVQHNQNFKHFADKLDKPETIQRIPIHKTNQIHCCSMNIKQSTTDGNIEVLDNLFHQGGIGDKSKVNFDAEHDVDMTEHVILVHGDLLTKEWVDSVWNSRKIEHTPKNHLQYIVFLLGLFHYKMACVDALWRTYIHPKEGCKDENSLYQHIGILQPDETGKMVSKPGFRRVHDVVHHDIWASILDCQHLEAESQNTEWSTLERFATSKPVWEDIINMSCVIMKKFIAMTQDLDAAQEKPLLQ
ncbi:uncharacterized protein F5891DRAFT_953413 [Suillus fuscotomentosus]|uniref:DUF6589 domain-containing protein n=1 Tax=Suillus fuscotomentosus TaxID=1912939 RepID=A0AAD4E5J4_9AGAM|nr:uncharacterized protein F5891DRAFT_953413 [Suillus fuscotomentosus]KAG1899747.1 hypothetical protein F5891DRAFT_953413 [Suillus fuscotomentosus]